MAVEGKVWNEGFFWKLHNDKDPRACSTSSSQYGLHQPYSSFLADAVCMVKNTDTVISEGNELLGLYDGVKIGSQWETFHLPPHTQGCMELYLLRLRGVGLSRDVDSRQQWRALISQHPGQWRHNVKQCGDATSGCSQRRCWKPGGHLFLPLRRRGLEGQTDCDGASCEGDGFVT